MKGVFENSNFVIRTDDNICLCWVVRSPTSNCQTASVAHADGLFSKDEKSIREGLKLIWESIQKPQLIIDVNEVYLERVKKYATEILVEQNYRNSTGSKMCLMLIKYR